MIRYLMTVAAVVVLFTSVGGTLFAHSGGTDANGCHMNHKTGVYHCH
jgi:hypothetical protein